ncbi:hypothetical protein HGRIS_005666 [Hohenbuehelia grisea]|uniref:Uncharacterized protein n=1 Tax=Hohenbuehelia grisea TaxID=104357 RepID=A0ABR3JYH0_9AGAR
MPGMNLSGYLLAFFFTAKLVAGGAHNDWAKPCFDGECAYELGAESGTSGVLSLLGSPKSLTDITDAAGWVVLDCDPHSMEQQIRLVCKSDNAEAAGCNHLFEHGGPNDKLVRLPESCGAGPFARIAKVHVDSDQKIPEHAHRKIVRRGDVMPLVHVVSIDTNYAAVNMEKVEPIRFRFVGLNVPDQKIDVNFHWDQNFEFFWDDIARWVAGAVNSVASFGANVWKGVTKVVDDVGQAIGQTAETAWRAFKNIPGYLRDATTFKFNNTLIEAEPSVKVDGHFEHKVQKQGSSVCAEAHIKVDVTGHAAAKAALGAVVEGSVLPLPEIREFAVVATLNGDVMANLHIQAGLSASFQPDEITLGELNLTPLQVPGLFALGPKLRVKAAVKAVFDLEMEIKASMAYKIEDVQLWWPARPASAPAAVKPKFNSYNTPISMSADANIHGIAFLEAHVRPGLELAISAGIGPVQAAAGLYVEVDAYGRLGAELDASASLKTKRAEELASSDQVPSGVRRAFIPPHSLKAREIAGTEVVAAKAKPAKPKSSPVSGKSDKKGKADKKSANKKANTKVNAASTGVSASGSLKGCVWFDVGVDIRFGGYGSFLKKEFKAEIAPIEVLKPLNLFEKCWATGSAQASRTAALQNTSFKSGSKAQCPKIGARTPLLSETDTTQGGLPNAPKAPPPSNTGRVDAPVVPIVEQKMCIVPHARFPLRRPC